MSSKYFRTPHLTFSPGATSDDRRLASNDRFLFRRIIMTRKMDGSNVCLERNDMFARTHSGRPSHPSFDLLKQTWPKLRSDIPEEWSLFGEWLYAVHSITYKDFSAQLIAFPFMLFGVRDNKKDEWFSWDDVVAVAAELCIQTVPVLFDGNIGTDQILQAKVLELHQTADNNYTGPNEGIVVRTADAFYSDEADESVSKHVRADHVATNADHWSKGIVVRNGMSESYYKEKN